MCTLIVIATMCLKTTHHILMIFIVSFVLVVEGVAGAASVLMLLVIGLSVLVVVMGVCLCRIKQKLYSLG